MSEPMHLLWIDLETTGLDKQKDYLLEAACFITDPVGNKIEGSEEEWIIIPSDPFWHKRMIPFVKDMHEASGLINDVTAPVLTAKHCSSTAWPRLFEQYVMDWKLALVQDKFTVAGSGVGPFDLPLLLLRYPHLETHFTYYVMDVGVIGRFVRNVCQIELPERPTVNHRAMDDLNEHYSEFLEYQEIMKEYNRFKETEYDNYQM